MRDLLEKSGFEVFLPLHKVIRQWSDRKKKVEMLLFNSYIFVNEEDHNIPSILKVPGIAWNIRSNGKPAILRQEELDLIKRFISSGLFLETSTLEREQFKSGDRARIIDGPLAGVTGIITGSSDDEKLNVVIEGIGQVIRVQIPAILLKKFV